MDMLHGPLVRKLLVFSLPLALTGLLQQLFNTADVFVLGHFAGKNAMAAVGNSTPIIGIIVSLFFGLSLGANVVVARSIGARSQERVKAIIQTSLLLALISGFGVAILSIPLAGVVTAFLDVPPEIFPMAEEYLRIYLYGIPAIAGFNFEAAIFRSRGDTRTPLIALAIASLLNIVLNLVFVWLGWGVAGVAAATDIANLVSAVFLFIGLLKTRGVIHPEFTGMHLDMDHLKSILRIGLPASVQMMVFSFANICIQQAINSLGADAMSASAAAFTIEINVYCVINSFGQAATTFVSQNYGAGNLARCREVTRKTLLLGIFCMGVLSCFLIGFAGPLLSLFNPDETVVRLGVLRVWYVLLPEIINVFLEIFSGSLRGYGISTPPAIIVLISICGIRLAWVYLYFPLSRTFETIMAVFGISWAVAAFFLAFAYGYYMHRLLKDAQKQYGRS